jgi:hypothetical protein
MDKKLFILLNDLSLRNMLPIEVIEAIVNSQFGLTYQMYSNAEKGKHETFKSIILPNLGKFVAKKTRLEWLNKCSDLKKAKLLKDDDITKREKLNNENIEILQDMAGTQEGTV